jgi:hypothetical protein
LIKANLLLPNMIRRVKASPKSSKPCRWPRLRYFVELSAHDNARVYAACQRGHIDRATKMRRVDRARAEKGRRSMRQATMSRNGRKHGSIVEAPVSPHIVTFVSAKTIPCPNILGCWHGTRLDGYCLMPRTKMALASHGGSRDYRCGDQRRPS